MRHSLPDNHNLFAHSRPVLRRIPHVALRRVPQHDDYASAGMPAFRPDAALRVCAHRALRSPQMLLYMALAPEAKLTCAHSPSRASSPTASSKGSDARARAFGPRQVQGGRPGGRRRLRGRRRGHRGQGLPRLRHLHVGAVRGLGRPGGRLSALFARAPDRRHTRC